jgi:hypothetical protein
MSLSFEEMEWHRFTNGILQNNEHNMGQIKNLLNSTGCGFCLAKFRQVTLHLGSGMMHSCHHPAPHKIPLDEIEANPAALFNTKHIKKARKQMLNGERPSECDYCWRVEDDGGNSDRFYKSLEGWASDYYDQIIQLDGSENIFPSYLEVSFSNVCNMKCTYCGPEFSSKWVEELKKDGPYVLLAGTDQETKMHQSYHNDSAIDRNRDYNPYIDAFWKWFPKALPHLRHYRITGGEPLMSKETFKSMRWLIENPNPEMEFSINSNFSVPDKLWDEFVKLLVEMRDANCVKKITVYTSLEGWGERAEYARTGLDFNLLKIRSEEIAEMDNIRLTIMAAFNILSITSIQPMLEWVYDLKMKNTPNNSIAELEEKTGFKISEYDFIERRNKNSSHMITVSLDIPYLRYPEQFDVHFCSHDLLEDYLFPALTYMSSHTSSEKWNHPGGFEDHELEKFKRIVLHRAYFNRKNRPERENHDDIIKGRAKFYDYIELLDKRRGTNFLKTFPEMKNFYETCKLSRDSLNGK